MQNIIIISVLVIVVGAAIFYIVKEKKKGKKCIGCPYSGTASCHCNAKGSVANKKREALKSR